jgi:hypothetical protein
MHAANWMQAAVLTGLNGLWGTTSTWWASARAAIFLAWVIPPHIHTSGRTYCTAPRVSSISNSQRIAFWGLVRM